jgi:LPXTG-motif cell wall-anchored protein
MNNNKKLKAIVLSLGLAAMMAPATMNAQINRGLLQNPYKDHDNSRRNESMMRVGDPKPIEGDITNDGFGNNAPIGSGLAILIGAGLGYVALKKKEDEQ